MREGCGKRQLTWEIAFGPMEMRADPLVSTPPAFGLEAARQILRETFGHEGSLKALAGERDQNFRVDGPEGSPFLFKISNPADDRSIIDMQTRALAHIGHTSPALPVMRTLPTAAGKPWDEVSGPDGRTYPVRMFTFLPGHRADAEALTIPAIRAFGRDAARLGRALRGFHHPAADYEILWDITNALKLRPLLGHIADGERRAQVERVLARFAERAAPVLPGLRAQVIHCDLSLDNVLLDEELRVSGIIDFGDMTHAPLVCDLAISIADVLHGRADAVAAAGELIRGYASVTPLEDEEAALLADLDAPRLATEITVSAWRSQVYPDNAAYSEGGEPGARDFLDRIEAEGIDAVGRRFREAAHGLPYRPSGTRALLERRRKALPRSPLFYADPVHIVRGEGAWLFDAEDRRYLDCYNNVPVVGHGHPRVARAVAQQQRLLATHSRYLHEAIVELAERLIGSMPPGLDAVMLVNSGSEANDLAWRIARWATGRSGAVVSSFAYHGLTEATHALSPEEWARAERPGHVALMPAPDGYRGAHRRDASPYWAELFAAEVSVAARSLGERGLAAVYVDPAFTADGILAPPPAYLAEVARRVRSLGGVLVADEVQAGHGRFGTGLWSFQPSGIEPDVVVMGKPMGNGFPVAALVARSGVLESVPEEVELFSTFGGNPVACAAALAVLDVIEEEGLVANAAAMGSHLRAGLAELADRHEVIGDVRGEGLLLGIELVSSRESRQPAAAVARAVADGMRERGVLIGATGPAGNVLKVRPPLVFGREHADLLLQTLDETLAAARG